eukprot:14115547-Ditylum_brightwellii.AAC.1
MGGILGADGVPVGGTGQVPRGPASGDWGDHPPPDCKDALRWPGGRHRGCRACGAAPQGGTTGSPEGSSNWRGGGDRDRGGEQGERGAGAGRAAGG